jgi:hypothetical protein
MPEKAMQTKIRLPPTSQEDALVQVRSWLRDQLEKRRGDTPLLFDVFSVVDALLKLEMPRVRERLEIHGMHVFERDPYTDSTPFMAAVWELVGRGVLVPVLQRTDERVPTFTGRHFVVTEYGERWIQGTAAVDYIPTEPERFGAVLGRHRELLGGVYHSRSQEALACYQAHAYLGCAVMCGAAAEAILLRVAIAKRGEEAVVPAYRGANGRSRVENMVVGQLGDHLRNAFLEFTALLKYWRDHAAHATESRLSEEEAFMAMLLLLRFALFAHERWAELTA